MNGVIDDTRSGDSAGKNARWKRGPCGLVLLLLAAGIISTAGCQSPMTVRGQTPDLLPGSEPPAITGTVDQALADVRVEGNNTIDTSAILSKIKSQSGRPADEKQIRDDISRLYETRWFFSVEPRYRQSAEGPVLVFRVIEKPMLKRDAEYRGNKRVKTKILAAEVNLKKDSAFDVRTNLEAVRRIETVYHDKGFRFVKVKLIKGGSKDDREVIFEIEEGPKVVVTDIQFKNNVAFSGPLLKTKVRTKTAILGAFGGKYDPSTIDDDIAALKQYYHGLGYFDVKITNKVAVAEERLNPFRRGDSNITLEYTIDEGERYKLGKIEVSGNEIFSTEELTREFKLNSGDYFNSRFLRKDVDGINDKYGELGRLFAKVDAVPRFLEEPGVVDLVYRIDEDQVYTIRRVNVHIEGDNPHTKESVVLNRTLTEPGDLANAKVIRKSERRLENELFERMPPSAPRVQISRVKAKTDSMDSIVRGQSIDGVLPEAPNPIFENSPQGDPFARALREPPGQVDLDYYVTEARTGRLMFGVGVNSDAGVVGSIVLEENNFDILRPPGSFQDIMDGTAWRGGGQRFRIEAIPGDQVSRYLVNWSDPYFMNTDYSVGVSGFFFNRFYPDWDEERLGGRVSIGKQLTREVSVAGAFRLESVNLSSPRVPTPMILQDALGDNFLSSFRLSVTHDTRDTPYLPGEGHYAQASFEQAFGDYNYPRGEAEFRQYFTTLQRPDGGGRHILSLSGELGWTGEDTPIFERYYAGGYQSFRGFAFRGVSPREMNVGIGGTWMALGSAEYQVPLTAAENVKAVVFTDIGTVEEDVSFSDFRATVGAGVRLTIPGMGPAPIALDWGIPVLKQDQDDKRLFSFYIGITR